MPMLKIHLRTGRTVQLAYPDGGLAGDGASVARADAVRFSDWAAIGAQAFDDSAVFDHIDGPTGHRTVVPFASIDYLEVL